MTANQDAQPPRPIRFWLPLILGVGSLAILLLLTVFELDDAGRRAEARARGDVAVMMSNLQGAITYRLRQHDMAGVQNVIANQGFHEHSKHVLFIDEQDKIVAATRLALVGAPLAAAVPELHAQLAGCKGNRWRGVIRLSTDHQRFFACYPAAVPHDVSDLERPSTGYLLTSYDLTRLKNGARVETTRRLSLVWLLFGAGYLAVLLLLRHALARRRIARIVDTTASLAAGKLDARARLAGRDELASIGAAVDGMAERLQSTDSELRRAHEELEERVRGRTAELSQANQRLEREIAARLQSEQSLRESEGRYRTLVDLSPEAAFVSSSGTIVYVNAAMVRLLAARNADALLGRALFEFLHPDCHEVVRARMRRLRETGCPNPPLLQRWLCFDGSIAEVEAVAAQIPWAEGRANLVMLRDVSEVKKREAWLQSLIETTQDAVISIDRQACIVLFNPAAEKIFGYSKVEVEGKKVNMLMGEPYASEHDEYLARYKRTGEAHAIGKIRTVVARRKSGEDFPIELSVTQVTAGSELNYAAFIRDISEKTKLQNELVEKQRLAAVGATAAKFAHEIGNPLNGMYMTAQLLERRLVNAGLNDESLLASFRRILREMARLNSLLSEFRAVYREERYDFRPTSITAVIRDVLNLERPNYISRGIHINDSVAPDIPELSADADKLKQVLLNLCKNGVEAMPQGGTLSVRAASDGVDAIVEISDTGIGIPEGVDIFQPFKTTKPAGTGLGLAIVRNILNAHKGTIAYRSTPRAGTTFTIKIPLGSQG